MLFNLFLAAESAGSTGTGNTTGNEQQSSPIMTVFLIFLVVAVVGLFIWQSISGKKKQKEAQERVNKLKKGDRVKTIGGVCGFVHEINDAENTFVLETGSGDAKSYVKFDKAAIYQTAPAEGYANAPAETETKAADKKEDVKKAEAEADVKAEVKDEPVTEEAPAEASEEKTADKE